MMSMISLHILQKHKVPLNISTVGYNVGDVQKNSVAHQGQADFGASCNGIKTAISVVFSSNIGDSMLKACQADILESLRHYFSDVLDHKLSPIPMKTDKPMTISLKPNWSWQQEGYQRDLKTLQKQLWQTSLRKVFLRESLKSVTGAVQVSLCPNQMVGSDW